MEIAIPYLTITFDVHLIRGQYLYNGNGMNGLRVRCNGV